MLKIFRAISMLEGLSFLLILSITLGMVSREFVYIVGMGHGILFMMYFIFSLLASHKQNWSVVVWGLVLIGSFIPFAFLPVESFLQKEQQKSDKSYKSDSIST